MRHKPNITILRLERGTSGRTKYGRPQYDTFYTMKRARLVRKRRSFINDQGVQGSVEADLWTDSSVELKEQDRITIDDDRRTVYIVMTADEIADTNGRVRGYRGGVVKKQLPRTGQAD